MLQFIESLDSHLGCTRRPQGRLNKSMGGHEVYGARAPVSVLFRRARSSAKLNGSPKLGNFESSLPVSPFGTFRA